MTDGDAHMAHTAGTVEFLARNGRISELIIVGIPNTDRTRDLTPTKGSGDLGTQFPTAGGADNFIKFIETELIPEIEKRYRVQPYRILAGHSFGGLFAVHTMITHPDLFKAYVAVSPSLQWSDEATLKRAEEFIKGRKESNATLFTSLGNEPGGIGTAFVKFRALLEKNPVKGFEFEVEQLTDEDHGSVVLRSHYPLRKVYEGWQMPRDAATGAVSGGMKGAKEHYAKLSRNLVMRFPVRRTDQSDWLSIPRQRQNDEDRDLQAQYRTLSGSANVYDSLRSIRKDRAHRSGHPLYEKATTLSAQSRIECRALQGKHVARMRR